MVISETVLLTHKNCHDGTSCALLFLAAGGKRENVYYATAGKVDQFLEEHQNLINGQQFLLIADLGIYNHSCLQKLQKRGNVFILDHHKTSLEFLPHYPEIAQLNLDYCGTELLRQYLNLTDKWFLAYAQLVDDIDRWQRKLLPISEDLNEFHAFFGSEKYLDKFTKTNLLQRWTQKGWLLPTEQELVEVVKLRREELDNLALQEIQQRQVLFGGQTLRIGYTLSRGSSLLLHKMLLTYPEIDIAAGFNLGANSVSLRSRANLDLTPFVKTLGGGGHPQACGHPLPNNLVAELIDQIHTGQKIHE